MTHPILVTGAAGGPQGSTGSLVAGSLVEKGFAVRAMVHKLDDRSDRLRERGAEVVQGDLLDLDSVRKALKGIKRAYFTYPVAEGLLEATAIFAIASREAGTELVVNLSQLQNTPDAPSFRNMQHRLADQIFDWAKVGAVHLNAPPFYENVRAMVANSVADQGKMFLPWGSGDTVFPLVGADDVADAAVALLANPSTPQQNGYELIGELPTVNEIANALGTVLNRPVSYVEITDEQWAQAVGGRINAHALDHLSHLWKYFRTLGIRKGEKGFRVSDTTPKLNERPPQTVEEFFRKNAEVFGGIRPGQVI